MMSSNGADSAPETGFRREYAAMTDDQLLAVAANRKDLVPEALTALDGELLRRRVKVAPAPQWHPDADLDDGSRCLEDHPDFRSLDRTRKFLGTFGYWIAFGPAVLGLISARYAYKDPDTYKAIAGWLALVFGYWVFVKIRISAFSCPQCAQRFGPGTSCYRCGFPRTSTREGSAKSEADPTA